MPPCATEVDIRGAWKLTVRHEAVKFLWRMNVVRRNNFVAMDSFPCVEEAIRVLVDEFCDQYRALRREVEILQEENQRLRRMLEYYSIPITRPPPPHSDNNESLRVLVQNCQTEKLKLKEILKKLVEKNPPSSPPKE
ncbi:hypothetical protein QYE76_042050 [Lolium multiflorum]|uniref:Uncharacterized protein n=1 Tax=Lolium multiflorum TaxID=4521 RepID=A0AAD8TG61_LOLMU|nr:hypothetical protein QYE76_042050 [Lolium multiflorum]